MRKHDRLALLFALITLAGAVMVYYGIVLPGQIVYFAGMLACVLLTKTVGAPLQGWLAMLACAGLGGVLDNWWLSAAAVPGYLAVNLRAFIFRENIYGKALFLEPLLAVAGLGVYIAANLLFPTGWEGWAFPALIVALGLLVGVMNARDRKNIGRKLAMGMIEPGTTAPDFKLTDQNGNEVSLADYKSKRDLLLIFVRGDWCPGCHIMLRLYERERKKFQDKNVMLFAIGPDPVGVNLAMVKKLGLEFAVLSDEKLEVSKKFCVSVQEDSLAPGLENGIPLPASFLVDKQGIIRYTSRADRAGEFLRPDMIFDILAKL